MAKKRFIGEDGKEYVAKEKKPIFKKVWFWILIFIAIGAAASQSDDGNKVETDGAIATTESASSNDSKVTDESESIVEDTTLAMGVEGMSETLSLVVNQVGESYEINEGQFYSYTPDDGKYALVNVTLKNTGKESVSLHNGMFKIRHDGAEYKGVTLIGIENDYITFESLNPGIAKTGNLVFNVPENLSVSEAILVFSGSGLLSSPIEFYLQ
ncbi:DUF4352 domain-containing protein [Jeotgalibaca porci]|uniref:DUF4352 domain-containing protein n=1 Tax=Jeotgalibaca porci TaxID=1868793 RepID=UPI0035A1C8CD